MNKESILIVDDEPVNIDVLANLLKDDYDLRVATNGKDAIELLNKVGVNLILLDISMPFMDGFETCGILKQNPKTKDIPIIFITANSDEKSIEKAYDAGGVDYITKPFKLKELTAKVKRELKLSSLIKNLETKVQEEILKRADQEKLLIEQSRLASMGEMIGNIAHQWRQPLNALSLVIGNIKDAYDFDRLDEAYINKSVEKSNKLIQKMSSTIDDFRDFFKPHKDKKEFIVEDVLEDTINLLEGTLEHNGINIEMELAGNSRIFGFQNELSQVIVNILNNAKDALKMNNIENPCIKIKTIHDKGSVYLSIEDNAGGIEGSIIGRVFEPYFTTKEQGSGTGIGLHMSKTIIEEHMDGKLSVKNSEDGAIFTIEMQLLSL